MPFPKDIYITLNAFTIARIGSNQLYAMAEEQLGFKDIWDIEIIDMVLQPVAIIDDEVRYLCKIIKYRKTN